MSEVNGQGRPQSMRCVDEHNPANHIGITAILQGPEVLIALMLSPAKNIGVQPSRAYPQSIPYPDERIKRCLAGFLLMTTLTTTQVNAFSLNNSVDNAFKGDWGQIKFNIRWRYEHVDQQGLGVASGDPIRLRLGYLSPYFSGFQSFVEFEGNTPVFENQYNSRCNTNTQLPVIADPQVAELNQGWVSYVGIPKIQLRAGRQRIVYDNARWIGNVAWRQLEQTFDSVSVVIKLLENMDVQSAYLWNVKNVLSKELSMSSPIFNLTYRLPEIGRLSAYAYLLDYRGVDPAILNLSSQSYGFRLTGKTEIFENFYATYKTEYAYQRDYQNNPNRYDASYFHVTGGMEISEINGELNRLGVELGWEHLGSQNNTALQTPLGTNHAFNGWADQFLTTPPQGLNDLYGALAMKIFGLRLATIYHQFDSATGNMDYGREIDAQVEKKFAGHYTVLFKYANYFANDFANDTQKIWLSVSVNF